MLKNIKILKVTLIEGKDLQAMDLDGRSDPYCILEVGNQQYKSKVKNRTLNPKWNEEFTFEIISEMQDLYIRVIDKDYLSKDDPMGTLSISISSILNAPKLPWEQWFSVDKKGYLLLRFEVFDR